MRRLTLFWRFVLALLLFTALILALWFGYHLITLASYTQIAKENAQLAAGRLLDQVSAEFSQMRSIAGVIAGSSHVQEFLLADTVEMHFKSAGNASEIVRNAAYPNLPASNVVTINTAGSYYRFMGGISNSACEALRLIVHETGTLYTIVELDGVLFFCYSEPVYMVSGQMPSRVGTVVLLTHLNRKRTALGGQDALPGMDTAVIQDSIIILSSAEELEGMPDEALSSGYGLVSRITIEGTNLSVAAAVANESMFPGRPLFLMTSVVLLFIMLIAIGSLYQYLSRYIVKPMASVIDGVASLSGELRGRLRELPVIGKHDFEALVHAINGMLDRTEEYSDELMGERQKLFDAEILRRDLRISLLNSQIDAHFLFNTITTIHDLSARGDHENASRMADGLAQIVKHRYNGDKPCNLFFEFEMIGQYIDIMNIWHKNKFKVEYDVDDRLADYIIPGLILQPVVENALIHGLQNKDGDAKLHIRGYTDGDSIILDVSDNGCGISPGDLRNLSKALEMTESRDFPEPGLSGVALTNIHRRIRLRHGESYGLSVSSAHGEGTTVTIRLPATPDGVRGQGSGLGIRGPRPEIW